MVHGETWFQSLRPSHSKTHQCLAICDRPALIFRRANLAGSLGKWEKAEGYVATVDMVFSNEPLQLSLGDPARLTVDSMECSVAAKERSVFPGSGGDSCSRNSL